MRIAFITPEYTTESSYSGGLANYLGRVAPALANAGHDVHVFTKSLENNEVSEVRGVTIHRVVPLWDPKMRIDRIDRLAPRSLYAPYQDLKAAWCLWRRWTIEHGKQPFDVVQVANVLAVGLFFRFTRKVPVVTRLSNYRPAWDEASGVAINRAVRARWFMEKVAIRGTAHTYAPSHYVARLTSKYYHTRQIDVIETPFYIEEPECDFSEYMRHGEGKSYLLFFGRLTQMKGAHLLAQALPDVLQQFPDMHVIFVGGDAIAPGGGEMSDYIRSHIRQFGDRVMILGPMRHDKLYPIVQNARVVAIPSLIDNLPNTCLEAMALERLVLATTGSCFEQLITDGQSGILVAPNDLEALQAGLVRAWQIDSDRRKEMGRLAKVRIDSLHPDVKLAELLDYLTTKCSASSVITPPLI